MNVSLTSTLEAFVRRKVASGLYNNASEVIREGLRLLVEREAAMAASTPAGGPRKDDVIRRLAALENLLRTKGIVSLALFGSALRGDARPDSDVDVLIDVAPGCSFSLVDLASVKNLLEEQLGRDVDVVMRAGIDPSLRDRVFDEAENVF